MPQQLEDITGFFWLALHRQLLTDNEVVAWADRMIVENAETDIRMIELSLSTGKAIDSVTDALRLFFSRFTSTAFKLFASLLHMRIMQGTLNEPQAANHLYGLYARNHEATDVLGMEICCIDEWFEPWASGPEKAKDQVRNYLAQFADEPALHEVGLF